MIYDYMEIVDRYFCSRFTMGDLVHAVTCVSSTPNKLETAGLLVLPDWPLHRFCRWFQCQCARAIEHVPIRISSFATYGQFVLYSLESLCFPSFNMRVSRGARS